MASVGGGWLSADVGVSRPEAHLTVVPEVAVGSQLPVENKKKKIIV